jgi:hypothetical protein
LKETSKRVEPLAICTILQKPDSTGEREGHNSTFAAKVRLSLFFKVREFEPLVNGFTKMAISTVHFLFQFGIRIMSNVFQATFKILQKTVFIIESYCGVESI